MALLGEDLQLLYSFAKCKYRREVQNSSQEGRGVVYYYSNSYPQPEAIAWVYDYDNIYIWLIKRYCLSTGVRGVGISGHHALLSQSTAPDVSLHTGTKRGDRRSPLHYK